MVVLVAPALVGLSGCGGQESPPRESAAPPPSREPAAPAERPQRPQRPKVKFPKITPPPKLESASSTRGSPGNLVPADLKDFAPVVRVSYLPEGFVLPSPAKAQEAPGAQLKPSRGIFDLVVDAPLDDVAKFLRREYRAEGWKVINDQEIEVNGVKGLNFLFGKDTNQKSASFSAQENEAGVLITVQYSDITKL